MRQSEKNVEKKEMQKRSRNTLQHFNTVEEKPRVESKKQRSTVEKLDIQSIPREYHISSNTETRSISHLQKQLMKDKFFHKEFNPSKSTNDDQKVKIINSLKKKEGDIMEYFTRKSKNEVISCSKFEKLETVTQHQLKC